ncbi:Ribonuclease H protein [Dioscorea alata]|uniref:Ribonuclease H protein n=1 Tax=Dioscorea alata TaxID=55571 RepID=A0ACB7UCG5_DIOAL|nr:Ribonuclease H protein [Dioscorea alata]
MVLVKLQPYRQHSVFLCKNHKLCMKYFGPFTVLQRIGSVAYKLELPEHSHIHPVFHVSLLKKLITDMASEAALLPPITMESGPLIQPELILQHCTVIRNNRHISQALVQWCGLPMSENSWEDIALLRSQYP